MTPKLLVLVDGHALVHRAYHAVPAGFMTSKGEPTNAVFGFTSMLLKVLDEVKPDFAAVTFDRSAPTFRHIASADYKATRPRAPDDLRRQFGRVREVVQAFSIPIFEIDGYEADDLLGCLARQAEAAGVDTIIVTGDLDTLQLVTDHVRVMAPRGRISDTVLYDVAAVRERYGLDPRQVPDLKALAGDTSDNIKGLSGVGPKTAAKLLADFGTVEGLYARLDEVPAKYRALLAADERLVRSNKRLATIDPSAPCVLDLDACRLNDYDRERVLSLFQDLEFRSLLGKLPTSAASTGNGHTSGAATSTGPAGQLPLFDVSTRHETDERPSLAPVATAPTPVAHRVIAERADLDRLVAAVRAAGTFVVHPVATQTTPIDFTVAGFALATGPADSWYVPVTQTGQLDEHMVLEQLRPLLQDPALGKITHNGKATTSLLAERGVTLRGLAFDTMVGAYLLNPAIRSASVKELVFQHLGREIEGAAALVPKGTTVLDAAPERLAAEALIEAGAVYELTGALEHDLQERAQLELFKRVELPLIPALSAIERAGVKVDERILGEMSRELASDIRRVEIDIYNTIGHQFTINSPQQLGRVLVEELHLPLTKRTKTGWSTDAAVLTELIGTHPVIELILTYRQLTKLKSTYIDALPQLINRRTGRIHTTFNQAVASTGRLSSEAPNLQNIPIRTEQGSLIRRAFIAGAPDDVLFAADYAQIELRIAAHITRDPLLIEAFEHDVDVHSATAATVFGVPLERVTPEQRRVAKTTNFAVLYGISDFGLSQRLGISRREADEFIAAYLDRYAGVRRYIDSTLSQARTRGYVETPLGRRRYIPELRSSNQNVRAAGERQAINMPIQGAQADLIKLAMIAVHDEITRRGLRTQMILQVHDELVFEVPRDELDEVATLVRTAMEGAMRLVVPIKVEMKIGQNWFDMEPYGAHARAA